MTTQVVAVQPKFVLKSMTIWGAIMQVVSMGVAVVGPIADATGYSNPVQPGDVELIGNTGMAAIGAIGTLVGAFFGIWGRFRAGKNAQPVTMAPNAAPVTVVVTPAGPASAAQPFPKRSG